MGSRTITERADATTSREREDALRRRLGPMVARYEASRGVSNAERVASRDALADELKASGVTIGVEVGGRIWRWSWAAGDIVSEPVTRRWKVPVSEAIRSYRVTLRETRRKVTDLGIESW